MMRMKVLAAAAVAALAIPLTADAGPIRGRTAAYGGAPIAAAPAADKAAPAAPAAPAAKPADAAAPAVVASGCNGGCGSCNGGCGRSGGFFRGLQLPPNQPPQFNNAPRLGFGFHQPPFQAAPWYVYWPYDQHFQLPAPIGAPFNAPQNLGGQWNPYFAPPAHGMGGLGGMPHGHPH